MSDDDILLREAVTLEDVMREVKALRDEVRKYQEAIEPEIEPIAIRSEYAQAAIDNAWSALQQAGIRG
jgi:predicted  nucleic acid-binding Zn-ribbon protein